MSSRPATNLFPNNYLWLLQTVACLVVLLTTKQLLVFLYSQEVASRVLSISCQVLSESLGLAFSYLFSSLELVLVVKSAMVNDLLLCNLLELFLLLSALP